MISLEIFDPITGMLVGEVHYVEHPRYRRKGVFLFNCFAVAELERKFRAAGFILVYKNRPDHISVVLNSWITKNNYGILVD